MIVLQKILADLDVKKVVGNTKIPIRELVFDSRKVNQGDVFVAIRGTLTDGHRYIDMAVERAAAAVVCEQLPKETKESVTYIKVQDAQIALARLASNFYQNPSNKLKLIGVTGTNGKTTIATLLYQLFKDAGYKVGLFSTVCVKILDKTFKSTHTTPDIVTINKNLDSMVSEQVAYCFMEVSSHGIDQKRIEGLHFEGAIFSNLTQDHLDYHKTFKAYRDTKKHLFDSLPASAFALVNSDDKNGSFMLQNTKAAPHTYALRSFADFKAKILEKTIEGMALHIQDQEVWVRLIGRFNAYNLLAIYGAAQLLGMSQNSLLTGISKLKSVAGRFQYTVSQQKITAIVDYAHTPDALLNVLQTLNDIRSQDQKLIAVVGCGGDRDQTKRPKMGKISAALSDQVIFTSDNPRFEDPNHIIEAMKKGVAEADSVKVIAILDRKQAIHKACQMANPRDLILIAGKGHETYQDAKGERKEFDDFKVVDTMLQTLNK